MALREGDYLHTERELYYVEHVASEHVILEDCRTGNLVDAAIEDIRGLARVHAGERRDLTVSRPRR